MITKKMSAPLPPPVPRERRLMSQGEVRPGMVQGQHWLAEAPISEQIPPLGPPNYINKIEVRAPYSARPEWIDTIAQIRAISPSLQPNLSLSNPESC
jgi:hypothetical protein